jgi:hypothetical protein
MMFTSAGKNEPVCTEKSQTLTPKVHRTEQLPKRCGGGIVIFENKFTGELLV